MKIWDQDWSEPPFSPSFFPALYEAERTAPERDALAAMRASERDGLPLSLSPSLISVSTFGGGGGGGGGGGKSYEGAGRRLSASQACALRAHVRPPGGSRVDLPNWPSERTTERLDRFMTAAFCNTDRTVYFPFQIEPNHGDRS